jgi:phosphohistidine phosphatase
MKILFIRHAEAVESGEWDGEDMTRPLTKQGRKEAANASRVLLAAAMKPDIFVSSAAVRARKTAKIIASKVGAELQEDSRLNPGCTFAAIKGILRSHAACKSVALVGHEPDFSLAIAALIGGGRAQIKMNKAACALVSLDDRGLGELRWLIPSFPIIGKT